MRCFIPHFQKCRDCEGTPHGHLFYTCIVSCLHRRDSKQVQTQAVLRGNTAVAIAVMALKRPETNRALQHPDRRSGKRQSLGSDLAFESGHLTVPLLGLSGVMPHIV